MGTEQTLSRCEELIMYCIWEAGGEVTGAQVQSMVNERFQKSYEKNNDMDIFKTPERERLCGCAQSKKL